MLVTYGYLCVDTVYVKSHLKTRFAVNLYSGTGNKGEKVPQIFFPVKRHKLPSSLSPGTSARPSARLQKIFFLM